MFCRNFMVGLVVVGLSSSFVDGAVAEEPASVEWVALGDSYTAGGFVGEQRSGNGCDRTVGAYPEQVGGRLGGDLVRLVDVSCGNATISDLHLTSQVPASPVGTPEGGWAAVAPQLEPVSADTAVVTIGVGGNSVPLGGLVMSCLLLGAGFPDDATPCRDAHTSGGDGQETIDQVLDRVASEYVELLEAVRAKAPSAAVITVGYPTIFPADASSCGREDTTAFAANVNDTLLSITHGDIEWLGQVVAELNTVIKDATEYVGAFRFVDTATSSVGHDVCQDAYDKWVEGVCGSAEWFWPSSITLGKPPMSFTLTCTDDTSATIVHPNLNGHRHVADLVEPVIREAVG